jgi:protein-S-isoprenylcysteine O-methyltransferase Ste14
MARLNPFGVGPRIAAISLPFLALSVTAGILWPSLFTFPGLPSSVTVPLGIVLILAFVVWYGATARTLLRGLKAGELVTSGPFRVCQNPLYASFILLLVPGLALLLKSWAVLTTALVVWAAFKASIGGEYEEMRAAFGERYEEYRRTTPELFPLRLGRRG